MPDASRETSLAALRWLIEAGADEAIVEEPINRLAQRTPSPLPEARKHASTLPQGEGWKTPPSRPQEEGRKSAAEAVSLSTAPGAARALAASCTTLSELKAALNNFEGCELKRYATNTVFADGTPDGRIMLIGEAPGRDEDAQGLPFVGRAGQLLDRMLTSIGLSREKVYITNVLNWRPPQNREPTPEEAAACLPFLHRHIELAAPELLILLGGVSVRHLLGRTEGILRLRGSWQIYQNAQLGRPIPVMPTLHPAYLLRQPAAKRLAWRDFLTINAKLQSLGLA